MPDGIVEAPLQAAASLSSPGQVWREALSLRRLGPLCPFGPLPSGDFFFPCVIDACASLCYNAPQMK